MIWKSYAINLPAAPAIKPLLLKVAAAPAMYTALTAAKKSSFQVGDDVILELRFKKEHSEDRDQTMMLPAKITKYELHGMSLFKGPHYELVFQPVTDVPCIAVERKLQKNGDSYGKTILRWGNNSDAFSRVWIKKYHPAQYPKACRDAITYNNTCNDY